MKSSLFHRLLSLIAVISLPLTALAQPENQPAAEQAKPARIEQMNPFTVSALYAAIEVQFTLSGKNLFKPLEDTVDSAEVISLQIRDPDVTPEIGIGDKIVAIDGVELHGKTLAEISKLLNQARAKGVPDMKISGNLGLSTKTIKFDGDWLVPLPGLKR